MGGLPEKRPHEYARHRPTSRFAAFNIADITVVSPPPRRHLTIEFRMFLTKIDTGVPTHLGMHLVPDNYGTHVRPA
jgi:hypothetical protein